MYMEIVSNLSEGEIKLLLKGKTVQIKRSKFSDLQPGDSPFINVGDNIAARRSTLADVSGNEAYWYVKLEPG